MQIRRTRLLGAILAGAMCVSLCACSSPKVMSFGEMDVSYDMLRYFACNHMKDMGKSAEDFENDPELQKQLEENVYDNLRELAAYVELAERYDITIGSSKKDSIKESISSQRDAYDSDADYQAYLDEHFMTEDLLYRLCEIDALCDLLYERLTSSVSTDEETIRKDIEDGNWYSAEYIGLTFESDTQDSERERIMNEMLTRVRSGESMSKISEEYQKVYGLGVVGYQNFGGFTNGQKTDYFEETVRNLEIGEYSEVCEIPGGGYYIAHRLAIEESYIEDHLSDVFLAGYLERYFFGIVDECAASLTPNYREKYSDLVLWKME